MFPVSGFSVRTMLTVRAILAAEYSDMSLPSMLTAPDSLGRNPAMVRSSVDLPAPLRPSRHVSSPPRTVALILWPMVFAPLRVLYPMLRSAISMVCTVVVMPAKVSNVGFRRAASTVKRS